MALHLVRSLGQAFDVCHRLNPRPKKTKKEAEEGEGEGEKKTEEGEEAAENADETTATNESQLSDALKEISLEEGGKNSKTAPQNDLMGLDFDPFVFNFETPGRAGAAPNGAPQGGFHSGYSAVGGGGGPMFPPLMVSNNPSGFPDLPVGSTSAQTQLQLMGRPRPRPAGSSNHQVGH